MSPAKINRTAYTYSSCGFSTMGAMTKYVDITKTKMGMISGTYKWTD